MYLIKIDLASVRKNPDAGRREYIRYLGPLITEETRISKENGWWVRRQYYCGRLTVEESIKLEDRPEQWEPSDYVISRHQPCERLYSSMPERKYFFAYLPTPVKCEDCGAEFDYKELQNFEVDYGDDYSTTNTGCPKCLAWDCCNLRYEKIEDLENVLCK